VFLTKPTEEVNDSTPQSEQIDLASQPSPEHIKYEDRLLTAAAVARWVGVHPQTLSVWSTEGRGPKVTRIGRYKRRFFVGDVLAWLREQPDSAPEMRRKYRWADRSTNPSTANTSTSTHNRSNLELQQSGAINDTGERRETA
jgi:hypothetical protein